MKGALNASVRAFVYTRNNAMSRSYLTNHGMSDKRVTTCLKETSKITALFDIHGLEER